MRSIPMSPLLGEMLLAWRVRCPRKGRQARAGLPRTRRRAGVAVTSRLGGGGPLIYGNFRKRFWTTTLKRLCLPAVTPHSARHSFISTLQAQSVEVGLVAKLAGHKNTVVTLSHYTHAVRGGEDAVKALDRAYAGTASLARSSCKRSNVQGQAAAAQPSRRSSQPPDPLPTPATDGQNPVAVP